ncbi:MAG: DUF3106 domain-containing protein, partial [Burkholderiales bacterium]
MTVRPATAVLLLSTLLALGAGRAAAADAPGAAGVEPAPAAASSLPTEAGTAPTEGVATVPATAQKAEPLRLDPPSADRLRPSLLPLVQPLWSDLSPAQQEVLAPFSAQWNALPITEKRAWADLASRFPKMKADEQKRVEKRIAEWAALTPDQRRLARANYRLAQKVGRENLLAEWENYQSMTPEQRSVLGSIGTSNTAARHV